MSPHAKSASARLGRSHACAFVAFAVALLALMSWGRRASVQVATILACEAGTRADARFALATSRCARAADDRSCAPSDDLFAGFTLAAPLGSSAVAPAAFLTRAPIDTAELAVLPSTWRDVARARGPPKTA